MLGSLPGVAMAAEGLSGTGSSGGLGGGLLGDQPRRFNILVNVVRAVGLHPKLAEMQHCYSSE